MNDLMNADEFGQLQTTGWWVFHKECSQDWRGGPFESKEDAERFVNGKLVDTDSCPGCKKATPDAANFAVRRVP